MPRFPVPQSPHFKSVLFFGGNTSKEMVAVSLFKTSLIFIQFFSPFHHLHTFRLRNYPLFSRKKIGRKSCFSSSAVSLAAMTFRIFCIRLSSAALCCAQSYSSSLKTSPDFPECFSYTAACAPGSPRSPWLSYGTGLPHRPASSYSAKDRHLYDQVQAAVAALLGILYIILALDQSNVILP